MHEDQEERPIEESSGGIDSDRFVLLIWSSSLLVLVVVVPAVLVLAYTWASMPLMIAATILSIIATLPHIGALGDINAGCGCIALLLGINELLLSLIGILHMIRAHLIAEHLGG